MAGPRQRGQGPGNTRLWPGPRHLALAECPRISCLLSVSPTALLGLLMGASRQGCGEGKLRGPWETAMGLGGQFIF